jgi:tRNA(Ile)-lysidine synthase
MKVPRSVFVAVSGGPDSMTALDFLRRNHEVVAIHFNHGTEHGREAERFVTSIMKTCGIPLIVGRIDREKAEGESREEFWRKERYAFFRQVVGDAPLVTAHTLDDAMENWVFTSLHGSPRLIPKQNGNILRPFILSRKVDMLEWCKQKGVPFVLDPGNMDLSFPRARIRNVIMPELLKINLGFPKVIAKMYMRGEDRVQDDTQ